MRIAIIGAGNVGTALSQAAVKAGHAVTLSSANPEHAATVAAATGAQAASSNVKAVQGAEIVILAVPGGVVKSVADEIASEVSGAIVVDSTNPLNETYSDLVIDDVSSAGDLQRRLPGTRVVKAFNTIFASRHAAPTENGTQLAAFLAGDDADAKARVSELAASLGYRPIDAGGIRFARALEEMAFLNITLNAGNGWVWQTAWKLVGPTTA